jgi:hypothetical protein
MKDYADFKSNLQGNAAGFRTVAAAASFTWTSRAPVIQSFSALFDTLELMKTTEKVVSNSKCMHFVFPELCVPVDNSTFEKLYGTTSKDKGRFLEVNKNSSKCSFPPSTHKARFFATRTSRS